MRDTDQQRRPTAGHPTAGHPTAGHPTVEEQVAGLTAMAMSALPVLDGAAFREVAARLAGGDGTPAWRRAAEQTLAAGLLAAVGEGWRRGWQPVDLMRFVDRRLGPQQQALLRAAVAAELERYTTATVDPRWAPQLAEAQARVWWPGHLTFLQACAGQESAGWDAVVPAALRLTDLLRRLPRIELLGPLPGEAAQAPAAASEATPPLQVDDRILNRVRALLAKAESTPYPAEAEAFTAGAQALMARHSIDHALLAAAGRVAADQPGGRRIGVDNPYEGPKVSLLNAVASANRCRLVWSKAYGFCTVVGFPSDLDTVDLLFTSLLVQATTAMTRAGSRSDRAGRSRTRAFRQSFLIAYAARIGERLTETIQVQTQEAAAEAGGGDLLPVLAARDGEVEKVTSELFPRLTSSSGGNVLDGEGWASGRAAADLASLTAASALTP